MIAVIIVLSLLLILMSFYIGASSGFNGLDDIDPSLQPSGENGQYTIKDLFIALTANPIGTIVYIAKRLPFPFLIFLAIIVWIVLNRNTRGYRNAIF